MALADLTSPDAVNAALDEQDRIGREAFLKKYGFREARLYFVRRGDRTYPSKAVTAAAHGYQHGRPLTSSEFSGGDDTVARRLRELGFAVLRADRDWIYSPNEIAIRADIHGTYGGAMQGGIEPSARTPNVMIYTDPEQGAKNGYDYDGWDSHDSNVFYYTGDGRFGDQKMVDGNKAILEHVQDGRTLRLWETIDTGRTAPAGGKRQKYLGEFYVDTDAPYRMAPAPDADGDPRQVVVFRLVRQGTTPADVTPAPPAAGTYAKPPSDDDFPALRPATDLEDDNRTAEDVSSHDTEADQSWATEDATVTFVASEQNETLEFEIAPTTGRIAKRDEAKLVGHFESWLKNHGGDPQRLRIKIPGERHELVTDTYDATTGVLYEAKSKSDRATVRLAIGQLLDYLRYAPEGSSGSILLPDEPTADVRRLIHSIGFALVYRKLGSWQVELSLVDAV